MFNLKLSAKHCCSCRLNHAKYSNSVVVSVISKEIMVDMKRFSKYPYTKTTICLFQTPCLKESFFNILTTFKEIAAILVTTLQTQRQRERLQTKSMKLRHILKTFSVNEMNFTSTLSFVIRVSLLLFKRNCHNCFPPKHLAY